MEIEIQFMHMLENLQTNMAHGAFGYAAKHCISNLTENNHQKTREAIGSD